MKDIFLSAKEVNELKETKQNIIIFDSSYFLPNTGINAIDEYNNEHIENAVFFDIDNISDPNNDLPHMFPSKDTFETQMRNLGLNNNDIVILGTGRAVLFAALTTMVGFAGLTVADNGAMKSLGFLMVLAILSTLGSSLIVLPAWLSLRRVKL